MVPWDPQDPPETKAPLAMLDHPVRALSCNIMSFRFSRKSTPLVTHMAIAQLRFNGDWFVKTKLKIIQKIHPSSDLHTYYPHCSLKCHGTRWGSLFERQDSSSLTWCSFSLFSQTECLMNNIIRSNWGLKGKYQGNFDLFW